MIYFSGNGQVEIMFDPNDLMPIKENQEDVIICRASTRNNHDLQDVEWYRIKNGKMILVSYNSSEDDYQRKGRDDALVGDRFLTITGKSKLIFFSIASSFSFFLYF